jgi:hypothetical protein
MSWQEITLGSNSVTRVSPISQLACDPFKELLWVTRVTRAHNAARPLVVACTQNVGHDILIHVHARPSVCLQVGSTDGVLSCCYSPSLECRVRVQSHPRGARLLQVTPFQHGVLTSSAAGVRFHNRGGVLQTEFETRSFLHQITAATVLGENFASTELILAGIAGATQQLTEEHGSAVERPTLAMIDITTNQLLRQVSLNASGREAHAADGDDDDARDVDTWCRCRSGVFVVGVDRLLHE